MKCLLHYDSLFGFAVIIFTHFSIHVLFVFVRQFPPIRILVSSNLTLFYADDRYNMGVIPSRKSLALCDRLSVSSFCRYANAFKSRTGVTTKAFLFLFMCMYTTCTSIFGRLIPLSLATILSVCISLLAGGGFQLFW